MFENVSPKEKAVDFKNYQEIRNLSDSKKTNENNKQLKRVQSKNKIYHGHAAQPETAKNRYKKKRKEGTRIRSF